MSKVKINLRKSYREQLRMFKTLSNAVRIKIREMFKKYGQRAGELYENFQEIPATYYDDYHKELFKILSQSARTIIPLMNTTLEKTRLTKSEDYIDPIIIKYINGFTAQNVTNITETTRKGIQADISLGLSEGLSTPTIAGNIQKSTKFKATRATMIARTETHQAMNYGNQEIAKKLDLKSPVKEWVSAMDDRSRDWHDAMNGRPPIPVDDAFKVLTPTAGGGVAERLMMYAGDPNGGATNVINCRCFVIYHDADDIVDRPVRPKSPVVTETPPPPITEVNATSLANPISGSAIVVNKTRKQLREDIKNSATSGKLDDYKPPRFTGKKNRGKTYYDEWDDEDLTRIDILLKEANELADMHNIPRLVGTSGVGKKNAKGAMGDGILYLNKKYFTGNKKVKISKGLEKQLGFTLGSTKLEIEIVGTRRPITRKVDIKSSFNDTQMFSASSYYLKDKKITSKTQITDDLRKDILFQENRSTVYHEMGHHVHQQLSLNADSADNIESLLNNYFRKASNKDAKLLRETNTTKLFPSQYSTTNSKEWFAENFTLYHQKGLRKYCSEDWIEFYEKEVLTRV